MGDKIPLNKIAEYWNEADNTLIWIHTILNGLYATNEEKLERIKKTVEHYKLFRNKGGL